MLQRVKVEITASLNNNSNNNNNNNNNTYLWCYHHDTSHFEISPGSSDECRTMSSI